MNMTILCSILAACLILISWCCFGKPNHSIVFQVIQSEISFNTSNVESAAVLKSEDNRYNVEIKLMPSAAKEFERITRRNIDKPANMVFNDKIISRAVIRSQIGGNFIVTGLTKEEADKFVQSIKK